MRKVSACALTAALLLVVAATATPAIGQDQPAERLRANRGDVAERSVAVEYVSIGQPNGRSRHHRSRLGFRHNLDGGAGKGDGAAGAWSKTAAGIGNRGQRAIPRRGRL